MALILVLAVITAALWALFPAKVLAHDDQAHFVVNGSAPRNDIDLTYFLTRLTTDRSLIIPSDLINIPDTEFEPVHDTKGPGYTNKTIWYRAPFFVESPDSPDGSTAFLEIGAAYLNDIALAIVSSDTGQTVWRDRVGDRIPSSPDQIVSLYHTAQWPQLAPGHYWLTIGVKTNSAHVLEARLLTEASVIAETGSNSYLKGVYLGILLVAFGIYLTFGVLSRDKAVCWYAVYILALFLVNLGVSGYAQLMFKSLWPLASDAITGSGSALTIGSSLIMWCYIIRLNEHFPRVFRAISGFAALTLLGFVTSTSDWYIFYTKTFFIPTIIVLVILLSFLVHIGCRERRLLAHSFLMVALGLPTLGAIVNLMMLIGALPINEFTKNIYSLSSTFHLVMIAIAMGFRTFRLASNRVEAFATSQRATQLAGEQRAFITMLSHEFRTPLAIIQRSAEILGLHLRGEPETIHGRLTTIRSNAGQLSGLVDAFLTKETLDSATFTTSREAVAIDQFLRDLIARRNREVQEQNVSLINSEFAVVEVDRILLERAIFNLIENARKYAPGAPVWIACNRSANGFVYIRVVDEGPGIPPDDLGKVLNAFYRGKDSSVTQGVGLGLHITNRIIMAHGGSMAISVGEHGGTTVLLKLPYNLDETVLGANEAHLRSLSGLGNPSKDGDR